MPKFTSSIESLHNFDNPVVWVGAKLMIVVHVNFKGFRLIIGGADGHRLHRLDFAHRGNFILFE